MSFWAQYQPLRANSRLVWHITLSKLDQRTLDTKMRMCDGVDPYTLRPGTDTSTDVDSRPEVTRTETWPTTYLVCSSTLEEMKALEYPEKTTNQARFLPCTIRWGLGFLALFCRRCLLEHS